MILAAPEIASLVAHMRRTGVAEIEIVDGDAALHVVLPEEATAPSATVAAGSPAIEATACGLFQPGHPARDAGPATGTRVEAGEIVGVIALGPLLQPVVAPAAGTLGRLLCAPGQRVDWGTALFQFMPLSGSLSGRKDV
jgi:biotin carboxyl carrier protein